MANFEDQLAELEKVVEKLERGDLSLEDNVSLFERGMSLSDACKKQLANAESRIEVLLEPKENGPVRVAELDVEVEEDDLDLDDGRL
ncbi:exodeoxyribonuclease VII small subunit [Granulicella paludicola]|uniref:exodeoxyribonuclease VII small subunit n=1 Tax=Granulicella paludicola TaxID=474951 RepID=UPI0021E0BA9F|nr:exodeoxyribonuclease VII small subunit [Granulicella paludicola]